MYKKLLVVSSTLALLAAVLIGRMTIANEASTKVNETPTLTLQEIPKVAREAILAHANRSKLNALSSEQINGVTCYEAEWLVSGIKNEVVVTSEGSVVETERIVSAESVPKKIRSIAAKYFPAGKAIEFEEKHVVHYEAEAIVDGKQIEVLLTATGVIVEAPGLDAPAKRGNKLDDDDADDDDNDNDDEVEDE